MASPSGPDSNRRPIPGYHYDRQKKKYFAIQQTKDPAVPYSTGWIKARKALELKEQTEERQSRRHIGQVKRSKIIESKLAGGLFARASASTPATKLDGSAILANGLTKECKLVLLQDRSWGQFTVRPRLDLGPSSVDIYTDNEERGLSASRWDRKGSIPRKSTGLKVRRNYSDYSRVNSLGYCFSFPGPTTSFTHNTQHNRLCKTWLAGTWSSGIAVMPTDITTHDQASGGNTILLGPGLSRNAGEVDVNCSAVPPAGAPFVFAIGTSHGLLTMNLDRHYETTYVNTPLRDILSVDCLPSSPTVVLSGSRDGKLRIIDLRSPPAAIEEQSITHTSAITHIKAISSNSVIAAGMRSSMRQYDLRFSREKSSTKFTRHVVSYPEYHNEASQRLGFDVDVDAGYIVAAQEPSVVHPAVQIFDIAGGHTLPSPLISPLVPQRDTFEKVQCIRIVDEGDGGLKTIWLSRRETLLRYSWN